MQDSTSCAVAPRRFDVTHAPGYTLATHLRKQRKHESQRIMTKPLPVLLWVSFALILSAAPCCHAEGIVASPDGQLQVEVSLDEAGTPRYSIELNEQAVLEPSKLGLVRDDQDFSQLLKLTGASDAQQVRDEYEILNGKRRHNVYVANERVFHFQSADGQPFDLQFRVSDDGVAFRYVFPEQDAATRTISEEVTSFKLPADSRAWLQPMSVAKTGWERTNPSYEEYYQIDIPVGTPSNLGAGWVFPALFRTPSGTWVLLSETGLGRNYCGCRLASDSPGGEYRIGFPDPREIYPGGEANPSSTLPWATPWRIIVVGSLATVTESMLGVHLAEPPNVEVDPTNLPGKSSWSWVLLKDGNTIFPVQKQFVDHAADMGMQYCLVDCLWDKQIGEEKLVELIEYARQKNVKIIVWYNSAGSWNTTPYTPRGKMLTHESRIKEFEKLKELGVAGLKIDFFGGDGQSMINYYHDILTDAAPFGFAINFHGATLPRGWQRTYPHLMTTEAIKGMEFITFEQRNADQAPTHNAMLPFTRNVFDPMDYTPMVLHRIPNIKMRTTSAHELATAILFTSGIQHLAETPDGMAHVPDYVKDFVRAIPRSWDDVKFLDGEPGKFVVLARRHGDDWWLAGINGEDSTRELSIDLEFLQSENSPNSRLHVITDGADGPKSFRSEQVALGETKWTLQIPPNGGFVATLAD